MPDLAERLRTLELRSCGRKLSASEAALGALDVSRSESSVADIRDCLDDKGYLYFREFLDPTAVQEARLKILHTLNEEGALDPSAPLAEGRARSGFRSDLQSEDERFPSVRSLVNHESIKHLFDRLLGGDSRALDHIWIRIKSPGRATAPHCDIVYMGRGTKNLFTIWIPLGDVPLELGPLVVLERSHRSEKLCSTYCEMDVDAKNNRTKWRFRHGGFFRGGQYTKNPVAAQRELGGRWLTTDFEAGDLMVFSAFTLHGTLDNQTDRVRTSADARYQLASDPMDPRWVKS